MQPTSCVERMESEESKLLVSYSLFSNIVCEKSKNQMTKHSQQNLPKRLELLILSEEHFPLNKDTNILCTLSQIHRKR
jgi:hypothetical protein